MFQVAHANACQDCLWTCFAPVKFSSIAAAPWQPESRCTLCTGDVNGDANGDVHVARDMAESKLSAFGLPVPRAMIMRQRSGGTPQLRGWRPPLAPTSHEPPSSATSSSRSLNTTQGAYSTAADTCASGYETPVQVSECKHAERMPQRMPCTLLCA